MDDAKIITATEASRSFSELLHRVCYGGESFIIKKGNRLMAHIAPVTQETVTAEPRQTESNTPMPPALAQTDAEYYEAVIEQIRKNVPEFSEEYDEAVMDESTI